MELLYQFYITHFHTTFLCYIVCIGFLYESVLPYTFLCIHVFYLLHNLFFKLVGGGGTTIGAFDNKDLNFNLFAF